MVFFCFVFFFLQLIFPRKKAKGNVSFQSFFFVVLGGGYVFFFFLGCFIFPREKEEKASFGKVLSLRATSSPGEAHCPCRLESRRLLAPPKSHPRRKESEQTHPWQRSFGCFKTSVMEGRGGWRESQTPGKDGDEDTREEEEEGRGGRRGRVPSAVVGPEAAP